MNWEFAALIFALATQIVVVYCTWLARSALKELIRFHEGHYAYKQLHLVATIFHVMAWFSLIVSGIAIFAAGFLIALLPR